MERRPDTGIASYNSMFGDLEAEPVFGLQKGERKTIFCLGEGGEDNPFEVHPVKGEKLAFYQVAYSEENDEDKYRPTRPLEITSHFEAYNDRAACGQYEIMLTAYGPDDKESGWDSILVQADAGQAPPNVSFPNYGYPSIQQDEIAYLNLKEVIGDAYGKFEAIWEELRLYGRGRGRRLR